MLTGITPPAPPLRPPYPSSWCVVFLLLSSTHLKQHKRYKFVLLLQLAQNKL